MRLGIMHGLCGYVLKGVFHPHASCERRSRCATLQGCYSSALSSERRQSALLTGECVNVRGESPERPVASVETVIRTEALSKYYGAHRGIVEVDLEVGEAEVFGFLGPNGAGKTTTIRLLLDHIRPTSGRATVFGIQTTADPVAIHRRVGYLPGEFSLYDGLTGAQTIEYFANLRGGVELGYQRALIERLDLDPSRRYREYSRGNKQKVALVAALQHRPELLILDEPTAGLDPLVQQDFFQLLQEATTEGRTVFLSSHIISEVERVCDRVAIIREGRLVEVDAVSALRRMAVHHVELRFAEAGPVADIERLAEVKVERTLDDSRVLVLQVAGPIGPVIEVAAQHRLLDVVSREPNLEDVFLAHYGRGNTDGRGGRSPETADVDSS
jgi:ABC-2 type transport system ATP-binding protein